MTRDTGIGYNPGMGYPKRGPRENGKFLPTGKSPRKNRKYVSTGRAPGRPRNDGLPPIQRKAIAAAAVEAVEEVDLVDPISGDPIPPEVVAAAVGEAAVAATKVNAKLVARIRYLAGRRCTPDDVSALLEDEFPTLPAIPAEAFKPGGVYHKHFRIGRSRVNLQVGETLVTKATEGKYVETMFWAKSEMGMAETAAGRAKVAQERDEDNDVREIEFSFADPVAQEPDPIPITRGRKRAAGGKAA